MTNRIAPESVVSTPIAPAYGQGGMVVLDHIRTWLIEDAIRRKLPKRRPLALLDIGCGYEARNLVRNFDALSEGWGIDIAIDPEVKSRSKLHFLEGNAEALVAELPEQRFDAVLFISVLEHLWNPQTGLEQCYRVLKPGGSLLINVPTWAAKPVLETSAFRLGTSTASSIDDHKMYYSKKQLWPMLIRAGFLPSKVRLKYQFFGMTLFAIAER